MKKFLLLLVAGFMFFGCAVIGFTLANRVDKAQQSVSLPSTAGSSAGENKGDEYRLIILYVDQLDSQKPALLSSWYVSLFFLEDGSPTLTFAQVYPNQKSPQLSAAMQKAFALDTQLDPGKPFWKSMDALRLNWESFLIIDRYSAQKFLEWANGPGDYAAWLDAPNDHTLEIQQAFNNSCRQVAGLDNHPKENFDWGEITPTHFHSNLRMEVAIAYWNRLVGATQPARCEVLLSH